MTVRLDEARCFNHPDRVAVAKCPGCSRFFCRECVTEHEGKMMCRECIEMSLVSEEKSPSGVSLINMIPFACAVLGLLALLLFFVLFGKIVGAIPSEFHSGTFLD